MPTPATHDAIIIGAGPAGLYAAFQLGIHGLTSVIVDSAGEIGGQCAALYADKPVYDMPGFIEILAGDIAPRLADQARRFSPLVRLDNQVRQVCRLDDGFAVDLESSDRLFATRVVLATGLGPFGSRIGRQVLSLPDGVVRSGGQIVVAPDSFETGCPGLHAIGDVALYPGKLALLASAFHEAALMAFAIRKARAGDGRVTLEYTSTASSMKAIFSAP